MSSSRHWLIFLCLCAAALPHSVFAQDADDEWMESAETKALVQERERRIAEELHRADDGWAGEYRSGYGVGFNARLLFAPEAGFVFMGSGCVGMYDLDYGDVELSADKVLLRSEPDKRRNALRRSPEFVPVLWGERRYLIAPDQFIDFANSINAGFEPCSPCGRFLLKEGDEQKKVRGQPSLPPEFAEYVLDEPIDARVLSVVETQVVETEFRPVRRTKVILDKGRMQGLRVGMALHVSAPRNAIATVKVVGVDRQSAEAMIEELGVGELLPSVDWELSTRAIGRE